ncbi:hypothetical protein ACT3CE_04320 [Marinifilum sp. RC60d5]|uniref:hypothetical protein n=1 Tax=Marinifilum sp. RC60d5 TaxID=3458414 RepID=UPI004036F717
MKKFWEYIFYRACKLDEFISGDAAEWTYFYGVIITTLFSTLGIYFIVSVFLYYCYPNYLIAFESFFKYLITIVLFSILFYVRNKKRYIKILKKTAKIPKKEKRLYSILSLLYIIIVVLGEFWIGDLIRNSNYMIGY